MKMNVWFLFLICISCISSAFAAPLSGLRGGDVFVQVNSTGALHVETTPTYGWQENLSLYSPAGKLLERVYPARSEYSRYSFSLKDAGVYKVHLSRSYVASVTGDQFRVSYEPLPYITSYQSSAPVRAYFQVPNGARAFTAYLENRRGLQGIDCSAELISPSGQRAGNLFKEGFTSSDIAKELNADTSNQQQGLSDLSPETLPTQFSPVKKSYDFPEDGVWQAVLSGARFGFWLEGIPNLVAVSPQGLFELPLTPQDISFEKGNEVDPPVLGAVGNFGENGCYGSRLNSYGVYADKLYLHGSGNSLSLARLGSPRYGRHTLLVIRSMPGEILNLSMPERAKEYAEWAAGEVRNYIENADISLDRLTVQPFNEPNLEMGVDEYLTYMEFVVSVFKKDSLLQKVHLGGPALGSAEADTVVDWQWIDKLLARFGDDISTVIWNCYKLGEMEDSFEYGNALAKTRKLINKYGGDQQIFIGATNRMGGLAPNVLFSGNEGAGWWASCLIDVINSGEADVVYYFMTVDSGGRAKGLFTSKGQPKKQALVQQAVDGILKKEKVFTLKCSSPLVKGLMGCSDGKSVIMLVNQAWFPIKPVLSGIGRIGQVRDVLENKELATDSPVNPGQVVIISVQ